jgi:hypothetical protein
MTVNVLPLGEKKLKVTDTTPLNLMKVTGTTTLKMTDFKVEPPAPKLALGMIKTGDEVKLIFDWRLVRRNPAAAAK